MLKSFNDKLDLKLIRLVKENPVLYDHNSVKYMDFNAREVAWQKIGDELKRPAHDCKVRWINIRDVNRRMLRKSLSNPGQRIRHYKYESELSFMRPFYRDVLAHHGEFESDGDDNNDGNDNDTEMIEEALEDIDNDSENEDEKPIQPPKTKRARKTVKKTKKAYEEPEAVFSEPATQPSELDPLDPVDAFLLSIGATLKTFTPYHLNLAKSKIFAVVQEHDLQQIVQRQRHDVPVSEVKVSGSDAVYLQ